MHQRKNLEIDLESEKPYVILPFYVTDTCYIISPRKLIVIYSSSRTAVATSGYMCNLARFQMQSYWN